MSWLIQHAFQKLGARPVTLAKNVQNTRNFGPHIELRYLSNSDRIQHVSEEGLAEKHLDLDLRKRSPILRITLSRESRNLHYHAWRKRMLDRIEIPGLDSIVQAHVLLNDFNGAMAREQFDAWKAEQDKNSV